MDLFVFSYGITEVVGEPVKQKRGVLPLLSLVLTLALRGDGS